ncbi:MAG: cytochrome b/b6 domain-containing protein [Campylobacteraceae bacterium]|nr:cytochrome b/b6 domain-containing protein [Campylobacteraceae bacterium]
MIPKIYSNPLVFLHWFQGILLTFILLSGTLVLSSIPNTIAKIGSLKVHIVLGLVIFILTIARLIILAKYPKPAKLTQMGVWREKLISLNHLLIYMVIIAMAISGVVLGKMTGLSDIVFFGSTLALPESFKALTIGVVHGVLSKVLIALIVIHIVGVFSYMLKTKENILKRMWFETTKG